MEFKNKYGQVSLQHESNIIIAHFTGYINERLVNDFSQALINRVKIFAGTPWGYISNSLSVQAATPEAEKGFINLTSHMIKEGCIASAYVLGSTLVTNQMQRVLHSADVNLDIQDYLFNSLDEAKSYIEKIMTEPAY
ncbi:hypothetical protein NQT69_02590 [Pseudoalteromonas shioyasakiensis]|uniref:hypothetical protein n=1 Tax=Pseudoalteromonas shioyasakiensis TaxID=1190813 RepID=UPI002117D429|nr:hypothetical protein [Pseudoalteromonas shioyasakiensis]MCQ8876922.1 hypothetical protein [Pseudoalteromonas shioyasakiensis]